MIDPGNLRSYVDDRADEGTFRVHPEIFSDAEIFQLELEHIFEKTWSFLGLESQIAKPNDYLRGHIGRAPILLTRDDANQIRGFLNVCRHRGALLARVDQGNSRSHVCAYHGWVYDSSGKNIVIKDQAEGDYCESFTNDNHDLIPLAKTANYKGMIFGSLNPDVPPLEEFLGDLKHVIDLAMEQGPKGMEVVPGRMRYTFPGNWKLQMDNGQDFYHLNSTHTSFLRVLQRRGTGEGHKDGRQYDWKKRMSQEAGMFQFDNGHNAVWINQPQPENRPIYPFMDEVRNRVGDAKAGWMLKNRNLLVFPNMQIAEATSLLIRVFRPISVNKTEMTVYCIGPVGEPAEQRAWRIRQFEDFFNPAGLATPDDNIIYQECQAGMSSPGGQWLQGYSRGLASMQKAPNDAAKTLGMNPRSSLSGHFNIQNETCFHPAYREWLRLIEAGMAGKKAYA